MKRTTERFSLHVNSRSLATEDKSSAVHGDGTSGMVLVQVWKGRESGGLVFCQAPVQPQSCFLQIDTRPDSMKTTKTIVS